MLQGLTAQGHTGAIWLNSELLSPYDYWQFWRNTDDRDVVRFLKLFTDLSLERIEELGQLEGAAVTEAKKVLADEATRMLHGAEVLPSIHETVASLFAGKSGSLDDLPKILLFKHEVQEGVGVVDVRLSLTAVHVLPVTPPPVPSSSVLMSNACLRVCGDRLMAGCTGMGGGENSCT
jgi:tyrosyl-tRNA synthetase